MYICMCTCMYVCRKYVPITDFLEVKRINQLKMLQIVEYAHSLLATIREKRSYAGGWSANFHTYNHIYLFIKCLFISLDFIQILLSRHFAH